jgi:ribulose 1,5-bisphosphate synthetase/thiazole synthase
MKGFTMNKDQSKNSKHRKVKNRREFIKTSGLMAGFLVANPILNINCQKSKLEKVDVCVYGGTASGVLAAIAAAKSGKSVILIEPSRWLGGMVGGGIRVLRDCISPVDIGGLTRMMMIKDIEIGGGIHDNQAALRAVFKDLVKGHRIKVIYEHRLGKVLKNGNRIKTIQLDYAPPEQDGCPAAKAIRVNAIEVTAKMFIDAGYEGDLMAGAGVSYVVGRETMDQYNESLAGVRNIRAFDVDPYITPGDHSSGLLPLISPEPIGDIGSASRHINAYNFRLQFVAPDEGTPLGEPDFYDEAQFELVNRAFKKDPKLVGWPSDNYDRTTLISGGIPGRQSDYPDGNWEERSKIWREWIDFTKIMHKLTGSQQTLKQGEHPDTGDFPHQLYIRLARRMVGRYIMTQDDLMLQTEINDPIGLGYSWFGMLDIYPCRLVATADRKVASEGEVFNTISPGPFQIPYRSLTPKTEECGNLLVPVCISASHVGLSSVRMEPTYMLMGESAGVAAVQAINEGKNVQDIDTAAYRQALLKSGQILAWDGTGYAQAGEDRQVWWETHPEEYQKRPLSEILRGSRETSDFETEVQRARNEL